MAPGENVQIAIFKGKHSLYYDLAPDSALGNTWEEGPCGPTEPRLGF